MALAAPGPGPRKPCNSGLTAGRMADRRFISRAVRAYQRLPIARVCSAIVRAVRTTARFAS
jgi:hypothetical protein